LGVALDPTPITDVEPLLTLNVPVTLRFVWCQCYPLFPRVHARGLIKASNSLKDGTGQIGVIAVGDGALRMLKSVDWRGPERIFFSRDSRYIGYDLPANRRGGELLPLEESEDVVPQHGLDRPDSGSVVEGDVLHPTEVCG